MIKTLIAVIFFISQVNVKSQNVDQDKTTSKSINDLPSWTAALSAHNDGLSDVAVDKLEKIEARSDLSNADLTRVRSLLVENLVRSGRYQEALDTAVGDELDFWRGIALAGLSKINEARPLLDKHINDTKDKFHTSAVLSLATAYESLEMYEDALKIVSDSVANSSEPSEKNPLIIFKLATLNLLLEKYDESIKASALNGNESAMIKNLKLLIQSKALYQKNNFSEAEELIKDIDIGIDKRTAKIHTSLESLRFNVQIGLENFDTAISIMRSAVENAPVDCETILFFDQLLKLKDKARNEIESLLINWTKSDNDDLSRKSKYFITYLNNSDKNEQSIASLKELSIGDDIISVRSKILLGRVLIINENYQSAIELLNSLNNTVQDQFIASEISFLLAEAHKKNNDIRSATESYLTVKNSDNSDAALFNAALLDLFANKENKSELNNQIVSRIVNKTVKGNIMLERGLLLTSKDSREAKRAIDVFIDEYPQHERIAEAHLAITSLFLLESPVNFEAAKISLEKGQAHAIRLTDKERADYLDFWIHENNSSIDLVESKGNEFVQKWPNSPHSPEIRMRLGEIFYLNKDYSKALLNFEKLYTDYPNSILAMRSMYFAAHSAKLTLTEEGIERALNLFQKVSESESQLSYKAILEKAKITLNKNLKDEAISHLNGLISSEASDKIKITALMLKGRALYEQGAASADKITEALKVFDMILEMEGLSVSSRNEAIFRKAKSFEFIAQNTKALELYYQILTAPRPPLAINEKPEMNWHFKAGFECIRILTNRGNNQDLRAAIIIADQLANINGSRSPEAKVISERLKLENFIWDE